MAVGGNIKVDTAQLQGCIERLTVVCNNIMQAKNRLADCMTRLQKVWTSIDANDRNTYINALSSHLGNLDQLAKVLTEFKTLLIYYIEGYEEQAGLRGDK